ncbi:MAG TPA: SDR family oxidoreductase [Gaiellaceae bacterium]|nr:SDR family oxidoreductase [Gaiellaceae bacterium]
MADVALVCGGRGALGAAIAEALAARGDEVVVADRETVDLTDADAVEAFWDELAAGGRTPRWVANAAGGFRPGPVSASDPESLRLATDLNLGTAWWTCRAAARRLPEGGAIVNVAARAALAGGSGAAAYAVAKAAVVRLTEVLALELAERRVRVNAILPSLLDTPANRAQGLAGGVPPGELASVVAFLLSDAAAAVSGAIVPVYGWS